MEYWRSHYGLQRSVEPHTMASCIWPDKSKSEINQSYFYNYQYIILLTLIFICAHMYAKEGPYCTLSFDILWCFHLTPSGNTFCCQPFYELFLDSLNPSDPSDLFDVSRTEYVSMLIGRLGNVGNVRNFVVSHGLFLKIQGGQAVFIFIWCSWYLKLDTFCDEKFSEDVLTKAVKINKTY